MLVCLFYIEFLEIHGMVGFNERILKMWDVKDIRWRYKLDPEFPRISFAWVMAANYFPPKEILFDGSLWIFTFISSILATSRGRQFLEFMRIQHHENK